jgi:hypothetical protein
MALRLLYLLFCQMMRWLALLVRSAAAKGEPARGMPDPPPKAAG